MSDDNTNVADPAAPTPEEFAAFDAEQANPATPADPAAAAPLTKDEQKQVAQLMKEYKLKVNGKDVIEKIDLNDEARIIKALQMEKAAQEAFQRASTKDKELASMNSQLDQFFELLKTDPLKVLMNPDLGLNAEELANRILDMKIEEELKDPKDKELEETRQKLKEFEQKEKEAKEEAEKLRTEKLQSEYEREVTTSISNAIDKGQLPSSPYIVAKFAQLLEVAIDRKLDIKADDIIPIVKDAYMRDMREMIGKLPDEIIEEMVTPDRIRGIRNKRIQAVKETNAKIGTNIKVDDTASQTVSKQEPKRKGDFWKKFGEF